MRRPDPPGSGIVLIDKPRGMTSFGVVAHLRRMTGIRRIGHAGTLDPFADGLLLMVIGRAAAAIQFMESFSKTYELDVEFGRTTDTLDLTGETLTRCAISPESARRLEESGFADLYAAVAGLTGDQEQVPPMYSAVKIGGRPLYAYARKGLTVERSSRLIRIHEAAVMKVSLDDTLRATMRIHCSKGTYLRSIADDLGRKLGFGAVASSLTRLQCGPFQLGQAHDPDELAAIFDSCPDQGVFVRQLTDRGILLPVSRALCELPGLELPQPLAERLICGLNVDLPQSEWPAQYGEPGRENGRLTISSRDLLVAVGRLVAVEPETFRIKTERVLIDLADLRQA